MIKKIADILDKVFSFLLGLGFGLIVLAIFLQVIARYVFNAPTRWSEELARYLFVWITMIGIPLAIRKQEHLKVELFQDKLSDMGRRLLTILEFFIVGAIFAFIGWASLGTLGPAGRQIAAGLRIPLSWIYISVPIGSGLAVFYCLEGIIGLISQRKIIAERRDETNGY